MTTALWTVIAFAAWTLLIMGFGIGTRRWYSIFLGRAELTSFPGDAPHGDVAYRRVVRAHANCIENLPVYAAIVLSAEALHVVPAYMDASAVGVIVCRIVQSSIHMLLPETNTTVAVRFSFFFAQYVAMSWMIVSMAALGLTGAG